MPTTRPPRHRAAPAGFTLIEMLVVVAVIAVLASFLFYAFRAARSGADRAGSLASLRALAQAHASYSIDNRGRLIPGYMNEMAQQNNSVITTLSDGFVVGTEAGATWVWRLSPYLDHSWRTMFSEVGAPELAEYSAQYDQRELVEISQRPSFGLNGIYIGGDSDNGGSPIAGLSPFDPSGGPTIAVTRMTEIRAPATTILFAPTRRVMGAGVAEPNRGWYELRAPFLADQQWETTVSPTGVASVVGSSGIDGTTAGLIFVRDGQRSVPIGYADGSAGPADIDTIGLDMRLWTPLAKAPAWIVN